MSLPVVYEPTTDSHRHSHRDALGYLRTHAAELSRQLHDHGALLLRGFAIEGAREFQDVVRTFAPELANYVGGDSPRRAVTDKVYTSTAYPAALPIALHNEMSYTREYPAVIAFYCEVAPVGGGETPIADCRRVLAGLSPETVARFRTRRVRYVQNLPDGAGLGKSWRDTFETTDRARVEAILRARGAEFAWLPNRGLRVAEVIDPIVTHRQTGAPVWFSQAHLWHVSSLDPKTREALRKVVKDEDLYHSCTYGDGTPLADAELAEIRAAFDRATVATPWRQRDVLVLDNVLVAHGRNPFLGERRILVAMG